MEKQSHLFMSELYIKIISIFYKVYNNPCYRKKLQLTGIKQMIRGYLNSCIKYFKVDFQ